MDGEAAYFSDSCKELTGDQLEETKKLFVEVLQKHGICTEHGPEQCSADDVEVNCGEFDGFNFDFGFRRKRSTPRPVLQFGFKVNIKQTPLADQVTNCTHSCSNVTDDFREECIQDCLTDLEQERSDQIKQVQRNLTELLNGTSSGNGAVLTVGDETIRPAGAHIPELPAIECPRGMVKINGKCGKFRIYLITGKFFVWTD